MFSAIQQLQLEDDRSFAGMIPDVHFAKIPQEPGKVTPITQNALIEHDVSPIQPLLHPAEIHSVVHAAPITALYSSKTTGSRLDIWA